MGGLESINPTSWVHLLAKGIQILCFWEVAECRGVAIEPSVMYTQKLGTTADQPHVGLRHRSAPVCPHCHYQTPPLYPNSELQHGSRTNLSVVTSKYYHGIIFMAKNAQLGQQSANHMV